MDAIESLEVDVFHCAMLMMLFALTFMISTNRQPR